MTKESMDEILGRYDYKADRVITIMQEIQTKEGFISEETVNYLAEKLGLTKSYIYSTASFYEFFSFKRRGKYVFRVCDGTTCYSHKSLDILQALYKELGIDAEHNTTEDGLITIETVPCMGVCGRGPNMELNGHIFTGLTPETAEDYIEVIRLSENGLEDDKEDM